MKKLIMCAVAVLGACALNAASVNWMMSDLYDANGESLIGTITLASGSFSSVATIDDTTASGTFTGATWGESPFSTGAAWTMTAKVKGDDGNMYEQVFNVILGTISDDDRANNAAFETMSAEAHDTMLPNGVLDTSDLVSEGWAKVSIPEPTSGLLLLLGGAMLALRRKRA